MTRKDYVKIAAIFKSMHPCDRILDSIIDDFCVMLKEDNSNFNEDKFREACGE